MNDDLWRVFISHSTADNRGGVASRLVDVLMTELPKHRIDRWVDRDGLFVGDEWRPKIAEEIHSSHVGIILLDEKALASDWVRDEAFLMQNEPADRNYQVIIVLIGLSRKDVKVRTFVDLVTNKHYVALDKVGFDGVLPELLRTLFCPALGLLQPGEMSLVRKVAELLPADTDTVRALTAPFHRPQDAPPLLAREFLAYLMLKARFDLLVHKMFHRGKRFFSLQQPPALRFLLSLLEPGWIPLDLVAQMVPPEGTGDRLGVVGTLPGAAHSISVDTGEAVVRRATHWDEDTCAVVPFGRLPEGTELDGLEAQLDDVDYWATNPDPTKYVVLQAGPLRSNPLEGVRRVHQRWPDVVVVLVIGPEAAHQEDLGTPCYHRTALSYDREAEARKEIDRIVDLLSIEKEAKSR